MASSKKNFFEQQIEKNKPPPEPKKERVWTPKAHGGTGAHTKETFGGQTVVKKNYGKPSGPPPAKKSLTDLP
ncbi:hypothetical protein QOT17_014005 [Balamuthia mandrillaris]